MLLWYFLKQVNHMLLERNCVAQTVLLLGFVLCIVSTPQRGLSLIELTIFIYSHISSCLGYVSFVHLVCSTCWPRRGTLLPVHCPSLVHVAFQHLYEPQTQKHLASSELVINVTFHTIVCYSLGSSVPSTGPSKNEWTNCKHSWVISLRPF